MIKLFSLIPTAHLFRNTQNLGSMESKNAHFLNCEYFLPLKIFAYPQQQKSTQIVYQSVKELTGRHPTRSISPNSLRQQRFGGRSFYSVSTQCQAFIFIGRLGAVYSFCSTPASISAQGRKAAHSTASAHRVKALISQAAKAGSLTLTTRLKITTL